MPRRRPRRPAPPPWFEVQGFKSLREPTRIEIGKLTVLAGANSSGKSAAFQPLLLQQTLEAEADPGALRIEGPNVRFSEPEQLLSRGTRKADAERSFSIVLGPRARSSPAMELRLCFEREHGYRFAARLEVRLGRANWVELREEMDPETYLQLLGDHEAAGTLRSLAGKWRVTTARRGLRTLVRAVLNEEVAAVAETNPFLWWVGVEPVADHEGWLQSIVHLPGLRGHRERRYPRSPSVRLDPFLVAPGVFTDHVAEILARWTEREKERKHRLREPLREVGEAMRRLGLTWKVQGRRETGVDIRLLVGRTPQSTRSGAHDLVDIADVGTGVSQALPVVVALVAAAPDQIVYVEQPELHLHPKAQVEMGRLLAEAGARGVRVVVETHSRRLLLGIQDTVLRHAGLEPSDVALHWFTRDSRTGFSKVHRAPLQPDGSIGDWPEDFHEVEAEAERNWLEAVLAREAAS